MAVKKIKKSKSSAKGSTVDSQDSTEKKESPVSIVQEITQTVMKEVISALKPDMELAIQNRFEEIKKVNAVVIIIQDKQYIYLVCNRFGRGNKKKMDSSAWNSGTNF